MPSRILKGGRILAAAVLATLVTPALAGPGDFNGDWHNVDPSTPDLKRVDIHPAMFGVDVHAFGACVPTACDWGTVHGHFVSGDTLEAKFKTSFSETWLTLHLTWQHNLEYKEHVHAFSGGYDHDSTGMLRPWGAWGPGGPPPAPGGPPPGPGWGPPGPQLGQEDCISLDPNAVTAANIGGDWKVVQGSMWILDYGGNAVAAARAADVIHHYHFTQQCFVKRPDAAMMYWKNGNAVPIGNMPGEDCISLNPANVQAQVVGGRWKVVDGGNWLLDYGGDHAAAAQAQAVIQTYNLNRQCFVVRPNAAMQYWLAQ